MVVFFHNRHVEPLQGLIRRLQADPDLTAAETDALRQQLATTGTRLEANMATVRQRFLGNARCGFLLGNLRFVVGEFEIHPTAMQIILRSEMVFGDSRVFNMPTGASGA